MRLVLTTILALCVCIGAVTLRAQIPTTFTLQGQLFQQNGDPVADGDHPVTVTFHAGPQTDDAIMVCSACTATFHLGVFTLELGDSALSPLPSMDQPYWVELSVDGSALKPRLRLGSVPYAMNAGGTVPVGAVLPFAGTSAMVPQGWALCDGHGMSSKSSPILWKVIGTTWGDGSNDDDPATDFNIPDMRGLFLRGADDGARDQYAQTRTHNAGTPSTNPDASLGTYAGTVEGFEGSPFRIRESPTKPSLGVDVEATIAVRTANAAVHYIIRVR